METTIINGEEYVEVDNSAAGDRAVVVVDRSWIFAGDREITDDRIRLHNAVWVFRWGPSGFDHVLTNPEDSSADVRPVPNQGIVDIPKISEVYSIPVQDRWGLKDGESDMTIRMNGKTYRKAALTNEASNTAVVVIDRGWIYAGTVVSTQPGRMEIQNPLWVYQWESVGFTGVLANPMEKTELRTMPHPIEIPASSEIFRVPVPEGWGRK